MAKALTEIVASRGKPRTIKSDNRNAFASKAMDQWVYDHQIEIDFSRRGKPTDNAKSKSFNGRFREECLNVHWFLSLKDVRWKNEAWREYYDEARPHSPLE